MTSAPEFWNAVFERKDRSYVKDRSADESIGMLCMVGAFEEELREAKAVLDVGPGEARLLHKVPEKVRFAIEVSEVNRGRLRGYGINPVIPGEPKIPNGAIDLAWSTSCFPHADYEMQDVLFAQVFKALRLGGVFYLEHVAQRSGYPEVGEEHRGPAGRFWRDPSNCVSIAERHGFHWTNTVVRSLGRDCPLTGYFLRLVKP